MIIEEYKNKDIANIQKQLCEFNSDIIIGSIEAKERTRSYYKHMSVEGFERKTFKYILCGSIAELFLSKLKSLGYNGRLVLLRHIGFYCLVVGQWPPTYKDGIENKIDLEFDVGYIDAVVNKKNDIIKEYEKRINFSEGKEGTHGVIEISLGPYTYVIDPTIGIIYCAGVNLLKNGIGVHESWTFLDQYKSIKASSHMIGRAFGLVYTTKAFWLNVKSSDYVNTLDPLFKGYYEK